MKRLLFCIALLSASSPLIAQSPEDEEAIREVINRQIECWNSGDLECFMQGYWKSDQLMFIGSRGLSYGWDTILENYKKSYPTNEIMGKVGMTVIELKPVCADAYFCVGKWQITRTGDNLEGHFSLLWRKVDGAWVIVADHSS